MLGAAFMRLAQDGSLCLDALEQLGEQIVEGRAP